MVNNPILVRDLKVCEDCLNDFGNHNYDSLTEKLRNNPNHEVKI